MYIRIVSPSSMLNSYSSLTNYSNPAWVVDVAHDTSVEHYVQQRNEGEFR